MTCSIWSHLTSSTSYLCELILQTALSLRQMVAQHVLVAFLVRRLKLDVGELIVDCLATAVNHSDLLVALSAFDGGHHRADKRWFVVLYGLRFVEQNSVSLLKNEAAAVIFLGLVEAFIIEVVILKLIAHVTGYLGDKARLLGRIELLLDGTDAIDDVCLHLL